MKCFISKLVNIVPLFYLHILGTVNSEVVTLFKTIRDVDGTFIYRGGAILMGEFTVRSTIECSKVCTESELCVGFNFRSGSKTCSLFPAGIEAFTREEQCRYFQVSFISINRVFCEFTPYPAQIQSYSYFFQNFG